MVAMKEALRIWKQQIQTTVRTAVAFMPPVRSYCQLVMVTAVWQRTMPTRPAKMSVRRRKR